MKNEIKVFSNREFGDVRTIEINNQPYFSATDVAKILGYNNPHDAISRHCKGVVKHEAPTNSGLQSLNFIPEGDVYRLIMRSQLPSAQKFEEWVCDEVLPSLRKNGGYIVGQEEMMPEQIVANALIVANQIIEEKNRKIKELSPKGQYFDALVSSKLLTTFRDTAKEYRMPPQEFTQWLVDNGYIYRDKHKMIKPYAEYVKQGLFEVKDFLTPYGYSNVQTYITVKGKETFRLLLQMSDMKNYENAI